MKNLKYFRVQSLAHLHSSVADQHWPISVNQNEGTSLESEHFRALFGLIRIQVELRDTMFWAEAQATQHFIEGCFLGYAVLHYTWKNILHWKTTNEGLRNWSNRPVTRQQQKVQAV